MILALMSMFCRRKLVLKPMAWKAVSSTTSAAAASVGETPGSTVRAKAPAASASTAMGAEKPSRSEAQPAR